uniref:C3H1-type domain-containing protein n=1 Tax=Engystomops pustulosus TaxID=76066 RepID=A0AAV6YLW6_ENGPU|nr:hypothetical protein GDO81_023138 [Engystomops pustulosus]
MGHIITQKSPATAPDLFVYLDTIISAFKIHGGTAWWRYDEEFRRCLSNNQSIGWASRATDIWLQLILAQRSQRPFLGTPTGTSQQPAPSSHKSTGACWLYNEGHCRFYSSCKFRHECSICGGNHPALRCFRRNKQNPVPQPENASERPQIKPMAKSVPKETGGKPS